jgi:N-acylneuraminate cytidylyltransferase
MQCLTRHYIQNASLEIRPESACVIYQPFFTQGYEGFDINTPEDLMLAETLVERNLAQLPKIERKSYYEVHTV